ncbi:TnsA endonuclease N-terminal domain-containing protein [Pseudomonas silvicola]|nr:TnsA endonuclease N-terminal domain-containing protein [Pseudomonas silvicola]
MTRNHPPVSPPRAFNPRRGKLVTRNYLDKLISEGVGSGERESYRPWLNIRSVPSRGRSSVIPGVRIARGHQCLSDCESAFLILIEFNPDVVDIREQFPLIDYDETFAIALQKKIEPALYVGTNVPYVFTTDFMLSIAEPGQDPSLVAISLKYKKEIDDASTDQKKRIFEKQEIEEEYWSRRGVRSKLCFYEDLPHTKIKNLTILRDYANLPLSIASDSNVRKVVVFLAEANPHDVANVSFRKLLRLISQNLYIDYKVVKDLFFYLVWHKKVKIDLDSNELNLSKPIKGLYVPSLGFSDNGRTSNGKFIHK